MRIYVLAGLAVALCSIAVAGLAAVVCGIKCFDHMRATTAVGPPLTHSPMDNCAAETVAMRL